MIDKDTNPENIARTSELSFVYECDVVRVVDGDTIDVDFLLGDMDVDLGLGVHMRLPEARLAKQRLRFYGINAPETNRKHEREAGLASKAWLVDQLDRAGHRIWIRTFKDKSGKYGRWLALLFVTEPRDGQFVWDNSLNKDMVNLGLAKLADY